jgi:hypothetical protein
MCVYKVRDNNFVHHVKQWLDGTSLGYAWKNDDIIIMIYHKFNS